MRETAKGHQPARADLYIFRLYVVAGARNSMSAQANLNAICHRYLAGRCELEIVDILKEPQRALAEGILVTPTLIKLAPEPQVHIAGNLSETSLVLQVLGIHAEEASDG